MSINLWTRFFHLASLQVRYVQVILTCNHSYIKYEARIKHTRYPVFKTNIHCIVEHFLK